MAVQTWEEILQAAQLSAEERKLIDNLVQRVPEFKDGRLRQADYSRKLSELDSRKKEYDEALDYNTRMKAWADEKVPIWEDLVEKGIVDEDGKYLWQDAKASLEKQLKEARELGGDVDPAKLEEIVNTKVQALIKDSGLKLSKEEIAAVHASEGKKMVDEAITAKYKEFETEFNEKRIPWMAGFTAGNTLMAVKYEKETGEPFTKDKQQEFFDMMSKEKNFDTYEMGEKFLKPIRDKKAQEAEIEKKAQELADKKIKEMGGLPGGGHEPFIPLPGESKGSLQRLLEESAAAEGDIESLAMAAGRKAAAELRSEGKR